MHDWFVDRVKVLRPTWHKIGHFGDFFPVNLLDKYWKIKTNTTTKQTCIRNKIYYNKKRTQRTTARFCRLLQPPSWNGKGLFWFRHFRNLSLTYLLIHLPTYLQPQDPHGVLICIKFSCVPMCIIQIPKQLILPQQKKTVSLHFD